MKAGGENEVRILKELYRVYKKQQLDIQNAVGKKTDVRDFINRNETLFIKNGMQKLIEEKKNEEHMYDQLIEGKTNTLRLIINYIDRFQRTTGMTDDEIKEGANIGGKNKKNKKVRKHKGIIQSGGNKGKLKKGYKYSTKILKSGLRQIVKIKKN